MRRCQPTLAVVLSACALLGMLVLGTERAWGQGIGDSALLSPVLDGDPRNPARFSTTRARVSETSRFGEIPNYRYRPAFGAGTTGFDSTGVSRKARSGQDGKPATGGKPSVTSAKASTTASTTNPSVPVPADVPPPPPKPAKPIGKLITIQPVAQPEPLSTLPAAPVRPLRTLPRLEPVFPRDAFLLPDLLQVPAALRPLPLPEAYPFAPTGIQMGAFVLRPAIEATRGYDTNPARTMPSSGSWYWVVAPQLMVNSLWSQHEFTANIRSTYNTYDTAHQLDRPMVDAKANGRIDISDLTRLDLEARYYMGTDSPGSPNVQANLLWFPIYHQLGGTAGLGQRFNRLELIVKGGADRTTYTDSHFDDGQVSSNADRNFNRFFTTGRANYELLPGLRPFTEVTHDRRVYDLDIDASGVNRNSQGLSGRMGSTFDFATLFLGEVSMGYLRRHYDDPSLTSFGA